MTRMKMRHEMLFMSGIFKGVKGIFLPYPVTCLGTGFQTPVSFFSFASNNAKIHKDIIFILDIGLKSNLKTSLLVDEI